MNHIFLAKNSFRILKSFILATALLISYACKSSSETVTPLDESKLNLEVKSQTPPLEKPIRPSSEQALRNYYQALNDYKYLRAWSYLTPEVQSEGYQNYLDWWSKIIKIDILSLELGPEDGYNSRVDSRLQYFTKSGQQINQIIRFDMVWDTISDRWLINKIEQLALLD